MVIMKIFIHKFMLGLLVIIIIQVGCKDTIVDDDGVVIPPPIPITSYHSPIWHPNGEFIGFNHIPVKNLHYIEGSKYPDRWEVEPDSNGFWLINVDGTDMRRIFPTQLQEPAWSPDGQWIAFVAGAQIYKMQFNGTTFDSTTLVQLTTEGRNFFPSWSPDGQCIVYDSNVNSPNGMNFIWKMKSDGSQKTIIAYDPTKGEIRMPSWSKIDDEILHIRYSTDFTSSEIFKMDKNGENSIRLTFNDFNDRYPKCSFDGIKIAFTSQPLNSQVNLWLMDSTGSNLRQLTTEGTSTASGPPFSWDKTGNFIVFTQYRFDQWPPQNGTLWILNIATGEKRQLTFNPEPSN